MDNTTPVVVAAVSGLAILAGHWFPWRAVLGRELHRTEAYIYGVTCIVGPTLLALTMAGQTWAGVVLACAVLGAGLSTLAAKAIDRAVEMRHRILDLEDKALYAARELPDDPAD